ncbi:MAG: hypothetical protein IT435_11835 [Phycisphaerales bacterium]|nr:hypothetical protein [Phycisphaerales bacterium]
MTQVASGGAELPRVRDTLFDAGRKAYTLAGCVERLEAVYAKETERIDSSWFYVGSTEQTGRELLDPLDLKPFPEVERKPRREAIDATLTLRAAIDCAIEAVVAAAPAMDSQHESADRRWTTRTIGQLRCLRGAITRGHTLDIFPSALPMIRAGVPAALREQADPLAERMEEVKTVILAAAQPSQSDGDQEPIPGPSDVKQWLDHVAKSDALLGSKPEGSENALRSRIIVARDAIFAAGVLLRAAGGLDPKYVEKARGVLLDYIDLARKAWVNAERVIGGRMPDVDRFAFDARLLLTAAWNETYDAFLNPDLRLMEKRARGFELHRDLGALLDRLGCMAPPVAGEGSPATVTAAQPETPQWVAASDAANWSGLSTDALRKRAQSERWPTRKSGRMNCYPLDKLKNAWPQRRFWPDASGK